MTNFPNKPKALKTALRPYHTIRDFRAPHISLGPNATTWPPSDANGTVVAQKFAAAGPVNELPISATHRSMAAH